MIHRIKQMAWYKSNIIFEVPTRRCSRPTPPWLPSSALTELPPKRGKKIVFRNSSSLFRTCRGKVRRRRQWRTEARTSAIAGLLTQSVPTKRAPAPSPDTVGGRIALSHTFVDPTFTVDKKSRCDVKFVTWLVRKNRALSMSKKDDELKVTDGVYTLSFVEVIFKNASTKMLFFSSQRRSKKNAAFRV
jgi:hypothetical protein